MDSFYTAAWPIKNALPADSPKVKLITEKVAEYLIADSASFFTDSAAFPCCSLAKVQNAM